MDAPLRTLLTPELAAELLKHRHPKQRRPAPQTVAIYSNEMRLGRWRPGVPDPILVDSDGLMFNGGHRCAAVVDCGVTIEVFIQYGANPSLFDVIDVGRRRSAGQFITAPEATARASAARVMLWYRRRFEFPLNARAMGIFDMAEILAEAERADGLFYQVMPIARSVYDYTNLSRSICLAAFTLAAEDGFAWDDLVEFREGIVGMADLAADDPRRVLAERMRLKRHRDRRRQPMEDWTILVRSLNRHLLHDRGDAIQLTQVWPRIGESEADFNRRRQAAKVAELRNRIGQDGYANRAG